MLFSAWGGLAKAQPAILRVTFWHPSLVSVGGVLLDPMPPREREPAPGVSGGTFKLKQVLTFLDNGC
jgi:hypothetical protein